MCSFPLRQFIHQKASTVKIRASILMISAGLLITFLGCAPNGYGNGRKSVQLLCCMEQINAFDKVLADRT